MNPCATCGAPVDISSDDPTCPVCAATQPPWEEPGGVVDPPARASAPARPSNTVFVDPPPEPAVPWAIPLREPSVPAGAEPEPPDRRKLGIAVAVVAAVAAVLVSAASLVGDDADAPEVEAASATSVLPTTTSPDPTTTIDVAGDTVATTSTTSTTTVETTTTTTTSTSTTTTTTTTTAPPAPSPAASEVPRLSGSFRGGWVAQVQSVPTSAGEDELLATYNRIRGDVPGAVATDSSRWSTLRDGFWVLLDPGPFASQSEARAFCASIRTECIARELR